MRIALADMRHEWILTLCQAVALAAVLGPLLLLLGLKNGVVETMRERLVQDPVFREIRPEASRPVPDALFRELEANPATSFILPNSLANTALGRAYAVDAPDREARVDALPTAPGDPLILENGARAPGSGEVVVSASLGSVLDLAPGDAIVFEVTRTLGGRRQREAVPLTVVSILAPRADGRDRIYVPSELVDDVERYKEGSPVPSRGWEGEPLRVAPVYDAALVLSPEAMASVSSLRLTLNTGFTSLDPLTPQEAGDRLGLPAPTASALILAARSPTGSSGVAALADKLIGRAASVLPLAEGVRVRVGDAGETTAVIGLSPDARGRELLGFDPPWPPRSGSRAPPPLGSIDQALLPADIIAALPIDAARITLVIEGAEQPLTVPVRIVGTAPGDRIVVPAALAGVMRAAYQGAVTYEEGSGELRPVFRRYGFRLYADRIENVSLLVDTLEERGTKVVAKTAEIDRLIELDRILTALFWLIAASGIAGAVAALAASLYGSVERKISDISMLRLLGFSRIAVSGFPVTQALTIAVASVALSFAIFACGSTVINAYFAETLALGADLCRLPPGHLAAAAGIALALAFLSSLFAAVRATSIDPAEAIRIE